MAVYMTHRVVWIRQQAGSYRSYVLDGSGRDDPVLALALVLLHRRIRAGKQAFHAFILGSKAGQPLADGDTESLAVVVEGQGLNFPLHALGYLQGHVRRAAGEDGGKFLATNASEQVTATQCGSATVGDTLQHVIAFLVAVGVVDGLEIIDIQHEKR